MPFPLQELELLHPSCIANVLQGNTLPRGGFIWYLANEIRPIDLYCYLYARFGPPNGLQNFLRQDSSDNLIHWDWTLSLENGLVTFQGHNFRTEIHCTGSFDEREYDRAETIDKIKADFASHGKEMSRVRTEILEKCTQFISPFARIKLAVDRLQFELIALNLTPETEKDKSMWDYAGSSTVGSSWKDVWGRYAKGVGLCFGIRSMLPVMAEAFVNLVLFLLLRPEIKADKRLLENAVRQPIDVRLKSLHINCIGFERPIDYSSTECSRYHSLVNERNDLLHGNVVLEKLAFGDVYFNRNVPVFIEYRSFWERSFGVELAAVGFDRVDEEVRIVDSLIEYVISCMRKSVQEEVRIVIAKRELGFNSKTHRVGVLFPEVLVDFRLGPENEFQKATETDVKGS